MNQDLMLPRVMRSDDVRVARLCKNVIQCEASSYPWL